MTKNEKKLVQRLMSIEGGVFFFCVVVIMPLCMRFFLVCHGGCAHVLCVPKYTAVATEKNPENYRG